MVPSSKLRNPDKSLPIPQDVINWMQHTPYHELVGSLNYLAVAICPDITFAIGRLATFLDCYQPEHWKAVIHVLQYVKGTSSLCLTLGGETTFNLQGYADTNFANCSDTSHSIGGYCYSLGSGVVLWRSKQQKHTTNSTCYAEYIALHNIGKELIFL